jgi:hypothetical protein
LLSVVTKCSFKCGHDRIVIEPRRDTSMPNAQGVPLPAGRREHDCDTPTRLEIHKYLKLHRNI